MPDQQQRPKLAPRPQERWVQAGEGPRQALQRPGAFEPVAPAEVCHNTVADLARLVAVALDQMHVLIAVPVLTDPLHAHVHFPQH